MQLAEKHFSYETRAHEQLHSDVLGENRSSGIVRIASVFVPQSHGDFYLQHLLDTAVPAYQAAPGLLAILVLKRSLVAYDEITTITTWRSTEHMRNCCESSAVTTTSAALLEREPPHVYQVIFDASRADQAEP